jgi:adenylate kinase family enzyme
MEFPLYKSKNTDLTTEFDLNDVVGRRNYFEAKLGDKIEKIKAYLDQHTFISFLLAKKGAGKGTYSKMFAEIVGESRIAHISVGDVIRDAYKLLNNLDDSKERKMLLEYINQNYRGYMDLNSAIQSLLNKSQSKLLPTELILSLVKYEISKNPKKAIFIDGFPRDLDQISYSLYFREIMNLRGEKDFFVLIDVPESIIDARLKSRVICPICQTSRNTVVLPTKFVSYDQASKEFKLKCDNQDCKGYESVELVRKEGDDLGIEAIKDRLELDGVLIERASSLHGVSRIYLRNAIPVEAASELVDEYELTPSFRYEYDPSTGNVTTLPEPWVVKDDQGVESYSLMAPTVVLSLFTQLADGLGIV